MEVYESKTDSKKIKNKDKIESNTFLEVEKILCNHCKRTSSNGIRCLGICVADNDYWQPLTYRKTNQRVI